MQKKHFKTFGVQVKEVTEAHFLFNNINRVRVTEEEIVTW